MSTVTITCMLSAQNHRCKEPLFKKNLNYVKYHLKYIQYWGAWVAQ